jgi:hypothetical protein
MPKEFIGGPVRGKTPWRGTGSFPIEAAYAASTNPSSTFSGIHFCIFSRKENSMPDTMRPLLA